MDKKLTAKEIVQNWVNKKGYGFSLQGQIATGFDGIDANEIVSLLESYASQHQQGLRWVKCSNRLPDDEKEYYVKCSSGEKNVAWYNLENKKWWWHAAGYDGKEPEVREGYIIKWLDESPSSDREQHKKDTWNFEDIV